MKASANQGRMQGVCVCVRSQLRTASLLFGDGIFSLVKSVNTTDSIVLEKKNNKVKNRGGERESAGASKIQIQKSQRHNNVVLTICAALHVQWAREKK